MVGSVDAVEIVRKALWESWFPAGHGYEIGEERLAQDFDAWEAISQADAKVAVDALVSAGLICNHGGNVYDRGDKQDK